MLLRDEFIKGRIPFDPYLWGDLVALLPDIGFYTL